MEPPEEVQSNGKSPISSSSAEVDEETEIGLQQLQGGGDDPLKSPQLPQMETRSRRQRASPSTYNEAVLLGESPPNKSTSKPKTKKGSSTKKGSAKAATLQDRKRRKVVPTEWAPENVFDIIQHTSYPTPTTLGGEDGQIRQGDDVVCPPALEPVTAHELKRMRLEAERSGHHSQREAAVLAQRSTAVSAGESPQTPMAMAAVDTPTDASLQKMSIATLLASGPASSAPPPLAEVSSLSINDIINAPGNDDNILAAEDFFSIALSSDTATDAVLGSIESQPEDEEVRQEWDKLADLLQEEQDKIQQEAKLNQQIPVGEEKVKHEAATAAPPSQPKSREEPLEETKQEVVGLAMTEAAGQDRSPQADAHNDALPAVVVEEQLPYGYLELDDEKEEEEEDSEDEYVEAGAPAPSAKGGKGGRGKASTTKGRAKGKAKGKTAAAKGQRKGRSSGGAAGKTTGTRKSGRRSQQDELAMPMDDPTAYTSTTTSPSTLPTSPLLSPAAPTAGGGGPSVAALAQLRKLEELHRRECTNGRETGCEFCSILDCKWGNEDHYRREKEGGCPCRETQTALPAASPSEEKAVTRGRTRSGRKSAESGYASAADTSLEDEIMALDAELLGGTKGEDSKGEKRKRFEVEDFNRPDELPLATLKLDSTKAVIDKTLIKEGKSVTSGYYKEAYSWADRTFINCDLRYYNLASLGKFDAILIDPPWRIKGNQLISNEKTMFNNSKWGLSYGTMSNDEIIDIDVGCLSDKGFIFLWVINSQIEFGFKCLQKWGYTYVDRITWVKKTASGNIAISQGYYFLHSSEICLVGVKYDAKGKSLEFISKTSNDLLFAEIREKSRKPDQLYHIIERMVPGGRKVEIFARNHNMRPGWLSLGNQLGEYYDWDHDLIRCDMCNGSIPTGKTRYKSRTVADSDLCAACYQKSGGSPEQYFEIENVMAEMAFHQYFACDGCETKPLWGLRFHCTQCDDCDLCELCYDKKTLPAHLKDTHSVDHKFDVIEMPDLAGGLPVHHEYRCLGCMTKPIIGYRFVCLACNGLSLCQKCFFLRKEPRNHKANHNMDIIVDSSNYDQFKCAVCALFPIKPVVYKCTSCLNYDLCESCHHDCAPPPATNTSHKPSHKFKMITVSTGN